MAYIVNRNSNKNTNLQYYFVQIIRYNIVIKYIMSSYTFLELIKVWYYVTVIKLYTKRDKYFIIITHQIENIK
jgi:hypothetical protein